MKIVIPGGTGQVGTILARAFHEDRHEVVVLSRRPRVTSSRDAPWRVVTWDAETMGNWTAEFEGADVVVNLVGRSVNCRYTPENRRLIKESRVKATQVVGQAIVSAKLPPRIWLQASTATLYAHRYDAPNDEATGIIGGTEPNVPETWRFSIDVAKSWEAAADAFVTPGTRMVKLRSAVIMSPDPGGAFDVLLGLVRHGLGGRNGDGRQYVSWIHGRDFVDAVYWVIGHEALEGAVNVAAPHPLPNVEFMHALRAAWGARFGLPSTEIMLAMGALLLRTETELILKSRRVVPTRLLDRGFSFQFPDWPEAAQDLCRQWRRGAPVLYKLKAGPDFGEVSVNDK